MIYKTILMTAVSFVAATGVAHAEDLRFMYQQAQQKQALTESATMYRVDVHAVKLQLGSGIVTAEGVASAFGNFYQHGVSHASVYKTGGDVLENSLSSDVEYMTIRFRFAGSAAEYRCQLTYRPKENAQVAFLANRCFNLETREPMPAVRFSRAAILGQ